MKERKLQGVIGVIEKDDKYLFGLESKAGPMNNKWRLLGGRLEPGEVSEQALHRELREEAGIEVKVDGYLGSVDGTHRDIAIDVFYGSYVSGEIRPKLDENSRIGWFSFEDTLLMDIECLSRSMFYVYLAEKEKQEEDWRRVRSDPFYWAGG